MEKDLFTLDPRHLQCRLLYPFHFSRRSQQIAAQRLDTLYHGQHPVWQKGRTRYDDRDFLEPVRQLLFGEETQGIVYRQVNGDLIQRWFRNQILLRTADAVVTVFITAAPGIELFLAPYGVGVLSLTIEFGQQAVNTADGAAQKQPLSLDDAKNWVYLCAQMHRRGDGPALYLPHPRATDDQRVTALLGHRAIPPEAKIPDPPLPDASLEQRLGEAGGEYRFDELLTFLIRPLTDPAPKSDPTLDFKAAQAQFSVYSTLRFGAAVRFDDPAIRQTLGPILAGIAQIEEVRHAGAAADELAVPHALLNANHWAAVSYLGAVHFVADQGNPSGEGLVVPFDEQRQQIVRDKYFIGYLTALFQRLTLQHTLAEAGAVVRGGSRESKTRDERLSNLRDDLLDFDVAAYFDEISCRDAHNRYYRLAQQGQGVSAAHERVKNAIAALDTDQLGRNLSANVDRVTAVQNKIEWLEVFFVSFYAVELVHLTGSSFHFTQEYEAWSLLATVPVSATLAFFGLRPDLEHEHKSWLSIGKVLAILAVLFVVWFGIGQIFFHDDDRAGHPVAEAHVQSPKHSSGEQGAASPPVVNTISK